MTSIHFLHVGKTGGTALIHALNRYCVPSQSSSSVVREMYHLGEVAEDSPLVIYVHPHQEGLMSVPKGEKVFFFLRDPISRFISGFDSRQRQGKPRYNTPWSPEEKVAFECFNTPNQLAMALSSTEKDKAEKAMRSIQHVKDSYWKWFRSYEYLKTRITDIFFVGFQETLDEDFETLKRRLDIPRDIVLPADPVLAFKDSPYLDTTLSEEAKVNLEMWYEEDYKLYNSFKDLIDTEKVKRTTLLGEW